MPYCAAVECNNSLKKGYRMVCFPKDPKRREKWAAQMRRKDWYPTDNSRLCEVHFEPEMWEKVRVDGKRKLRGNALPTIFTSMDPVPPKETSAEEVSVNS